MVVPLIVGNLVFIANGIYVQYSWDIMEPISYFINSGVSVALLSTFLLTENDYSQKGVFEFLKHRHLEKLKT